MCRAAPLRALWDVNSWLLLTLTGSETFTDETWRDDEALLGASPGGPVGAGFLSVAVTSGVDVSCCFPSASCFVGCWACWCADFLLPGVAVRNAIGFLHVFPWLLVSLLDVCFSVTPPSLLSVAFLFCTLLRERWRMNLPFSSVTQLRLCLFVVKRKWSVMRTEARTLMWIYFPTWRNKDVTLTYSGLRLSFQRVLNHFLMTNRIFGKCRQHSRGSLTAHGIWGSQEDLGVTKTESSGTNLDTLNDPLSLICF